MVVNVRIRRGWGSLAATSELVKVLCALGCLTRRSDPDDGRAKLIELTDRGQRLLADAGERVADIEARWSKLVGTGDFAHMCDTMQRLLDTLDPSESRR
ncbi:MAG: MarR family winged helix-turn-helix transcriptional regulator [Mycobacterium pseudokansasii]|nr:MarR family winged helix-turn-helix transcriptional regulator [Mycobacterium pseudokansasii]